MRRFSIRFLMGSILALAVAFAALRDANDLWAGGLMLATLGLLGAALLGVAYGRERIRAGWLGFLVFAGGYLLAVLMLPEGDRERLPASQFLIYAHSRATGTTSITLSGILAAPGTPSGSVAAWQAVAPTVVNSSANGSFFVTSAPGVPRIWARVLPGAASGEPFHRVGHYLFALLSGLIGVGIARRMQAKGASAG